MAPATQSTTVADTKKTSVSQNQGLKSALKNFFGKKKDPIGGSLKFHEAGIAEAENEEDDSWLQQLH